MYITLPQEFPQNVLNTAELLVTPFT